MKKSLSVLLAGALAAAMLFTGCSTSSSSVSETSTANSSDSNAEISTEADASSADSDAAEIWTKNNISLHRNILIQQLLMNALI